MTNQLKGRSHHGFFGSLNNGRALPLLEPGELAVSENTVHDPSISKRPGMAVLCELASQDEPLCAPVIAAATTATGELEEREYFIRITYATAAGETDDMHARADQLEPCAPESVITLTGGENAITVNVPIHLRLAEVTEVEQYQIGDTAGVIGWDQGQPTTPLAPGDCPSGAVIPARSSILPWSGVTFDAYTRLTTFKLAADIVPLCDDDLVIDWNVYSRAPIVQDETHLGVNCGSAWPLYNRRKALGQVLGYDSATGYWLMSGHARLMSGQDEEYDTVDIMMPDRNGLPITHANVYISQDGINFYYAQVVSIDGSAAVVVEKFDDTQVLAPSTRVPRYAPALAAVTAYDQKPGECGQWPTRTNLVGGVYGIRYTWTVGEEDILASPGLDDALVLLDWGPYNPVHRYEQETWPSCRAVVGISDDQGIRVTPPDLPEDASGWNVYGEKLEPYDTVSMVGGSRDPLQGGGGSFRAQSCAWYLGDNDLDPTDPVDGAILNAAYAAIDTWTPDQKKSHAAYDEYAGGSALIINAEDQLALYARGFRPAYEDVRPHQDTGTGEHLRLFASSRDGGNPLYSGQPVVIGEIPINEQLYCLYMDPAAGHTTDTNFATVVLRMRVRAGRSSDYSPKTTGSTTLRIWDNANLQWVSLKSDFEENGTFTEYRLNLASPLSYLYTANANQYLAFSVKGTASVGFDVAEIKVELFDEPVSGGCAQCEEAEVIDFANSTYATNQGLQFFRFKETKAFYIPENDATDAVAAALALGIHTAHPTNKWNSPAEEYGDQSQYATGVLDPEDPSTRGYAPAYEDVIDDRYMYGTKTLLNWHSSSRDGAAPPIPINSNMWTFYLGGTARPEIGCVVLHLKMRTRAGGVGFDPLVGDSRMVRWWDHGTTTWTAFQDVIPTTDEFLVYRYRLPWSTTYAYPGAEFGTLDDTFYAVFDIIAEDFNGFDIEECWLELYTSGDCDPVVNKDEVCQVDALTAASYTLQNPIVMRPKSTDATDEPSLMGSWLSLRPNTTAQWPMRVASIPLVNDEGVQSERVLNFFGVADSLFAAEDDGTMTRVYQEEGNYWAFTVGYDWQFTNDLWRVFACNPGKADWNLRYDGEQTWPMGLPWPALGTENTDEANNYDPPGDASASTGAARACSVVGEQPMGTVIDTVSLPLDCEDNPVDPDNPCLCFDVEYYMVVKRVLRTAGRGYVVRSRPRLLTETVTVCGSDDFTPRVAFEWTWCPEPQATHIEIYRNIAGTARYFLVDEIPINKSLERDDDGLLVFSYDDEIPTADEDLQFPMFDETGRPPAAAMMLFHRGRVWFVQQDQREMISYTNVTSTSGARDPEGFWPTHVIDPPMRQASAITCLSHYHSVVLAQSDNGIVAVDGISDDLNDPSALSANALLADGGAIGPSAWVNIDNMQLVMTKKGPAVILGDELKYIGSFVEGTVGDLNLNTLPAWSTHLVHYRTKGVSQIWFTTCDNPHGRMKTAIVFDSEVEGAGDPAQMWKTWNRMPLHSCVISEDASGDEYPLMAGGKGRAFRHGVKGNTDAGLFIPCRLRTGAYEEGGPSKKFQPRYLYFKSSGDRSHWVVLNVLKDFEGSPAVNLRDIRLRMGGGIRFYWGRDGRLSWGIEHPKTHDTVVWSGDRERPWIEERVSVGGVFSQIQLELLHSLESWPVGAPRGMTFESTGYTIFLRGLGERMAKGSNS